MEIAAKPNIFARTIWENVLFGYNSKTTRPPPNDDAIWLAFLEMADIAHFVQSLPNGLDEKLTKQESLVSGGQLLRLYGVHLFGVWRIRRFGFAR